MTGDESWVYGYELETEVQSPQWRHSASMRTTKCKVGLQHQLLTVFCGSCGVMHHEYTLGSGHSSPLWYCMTHTTGLFGNWQAMVVGEFRSVLSGPGSCCYWCGYLLVGLRWCVDILCGKWLSNLWWMFHSGDSGEVGDPLSLHMYMYTYWFYCCCCHCSFL